MKSLEDIFVKLELCEDALVRLSDEHWETKVRFPSRIYRLLNNNIIKPNALFYFDNKPLILFYENPKNKKALHQAIWNFNESPIVIVLEKGTVEIFNGFHFLKEGNLLEKIGGEDKLNDFNYFELVTGRTWDKYQKSLSEKNRVDYNLLSNIQNARKLIISEFLPTINDKIKAKLSNALLGKIIFVRYLIDRKVKISFNEEPREWTNDEFCQLLSKPQKIKQFFDYLADTEKGFNGNLFPIENNEYKQIPATVYPIIKRLLKSEDMGSGQLSLFNLYDFSIIPIEFISNIYESFIGMENQAKDGVYYTPLFLVDYILSETIQKQLTKVNNTNCKVLDPSCGSGVFLVETLRKLIEQYLLNNPSIKRNSKQFKLDIKKIVEDNIFGIDKDESAIQVAIFSVYLTLLDYLNPPEIETFKFPKLLNTNFFCSDFFDENATFNNILQEKDFTFILGNPPWKRGKNEKKTPLYMSYINNRRKNEEKTPSIDIGNKEIAQAFLLRSSDFSKEDTKCALIVTSKVLYNLQSKNFRQYFLHNYLIERVFELAPVRREVFDKSQDKAIAPACVLFFNFAKDQNTDNNLIEHIALKPSRFFSMFKIFTLNRHDIQTVQQDRLKKCDWLWKVLVYGSYLDFNFIKRLKEGFLTIQETIDKNGNLIIGQGVMIGGGDKNDASDLMNKRYLDTKTDIGQFWINSDNNKTWKHDIVHRPRNKELYKAPMLLITEGVTNELKSVSAVCYQNFIYKSSITGIKGKTKNEINVLRQLAGLLTSSIFSYYNLMTFSSSGIEREQSHDEEKLNVPFTESNNLSNIVEDIEELLIQKYKMALEDSNIQLKISEKYIELDKSICKAFSLTKKEECLLDYTNSVTIPIQMQHKNYERQFDQLEASAPTLIDYANLFIERFKSSFISSGKKFIVEIWHTERIIGMFFKVIPESKYKQNIIVKEEHKSMSSLLQKIIQLGNEKITDKLFIQKDIRGFEKDFFYVFKPNEKRLWHKAVGYLDVDEFMDAILKAGRDNK